MKDINIFASVNDSQVKKGNLGDLFGYELISFLSKYIPLQYQRKSLQDTWDSDIVVAIVGSIVHVCAKKARQQNKRIVILGCGCIDSSPINPSHLDIVGVRGPLTKKRLGNPNVEIMSDPGLLLSVMYPLSPQKKKKSIGFIIHSVDRKLFQTLFPQYQSNLVNNYSTYTQFTKELANYEQIVSSSLHGIIFSHSYGIPVCPIQLTHNIQGGEFKYKDYYHSLGNTLFEKRIQVTQKTNFQELLDNQWQPSLSKIRDLQKKQLTRLLSYLI